MKRTEYTCDKCGVIDYGEFENAFPKGWRIIRYNIDRYTNYQKELCPDCCKLLGIDTTYENYEKTEKSIAERLVDILSEIAQTNGQ